MPEPTAISETLKDFGAQREQTCSCGATFTQTKMVHVWRPDFCSKCRGLHEVDRTESTRAAARTVLLGALEIPPLYEHVTLETFELHGDQKQQERQARILQLARRYLASWPDVAGVLVFRGGPGSGKGHVTWSIAKKIASELGASARVCKLPDVVRDLREAWRDETGPSENARLRTYREPDFLAIDEVSRHAFYGEPRQHLYDLIDHRIERGKACLLTTNEDAAGLAEILGPALVSRTAGSGIWEFGNADFRLRPLA
jgi:DNA replication protein DnaC